MNILHLVSYAVFSGPLPPTVQLAQAQRALGHNAWVAHDTLRGAFSPYEEGADEAVVRSGVMLPDRPLGLSPKAGLRQLWRDRKVLRRLAFELELDVVHTHLSHDHALVALAGLSSLPTKARVRRVHTIHATRQLSRAPQRRWLWRFTDGLVVRSSADQSAVAAVVPRAARTPIALIPAAIDTQRWSPPGAAARTSGPAALAQLPQTAALMVHVALMAGRGQRELLEAWQLFYRGLTGAPSTSPATALPHLAFVGDGPERPALEERCAALGLRHCVHFVGYIPAPTLRVVYARAAGAFVGQPGNDAGARAALEALAAGVPLIAVAARAQDALAELVAGGRGQLLADRHVATLRAALDVWWREQRNDPSRREANVRWLRETRSPAREAQATLALYAQSGQGEPNLARAAKHQVDERLNGA